VCVVECTICVGLDISMLANSLPGFSQYLLYRSIQTLFLLPNWLVSKFYWVWDGKQKFSSLANMISFISAVKLFVCLDVKSFDLEIVFNVGEQYLHSINRCFLVSLLKIITKSPCILCFNTLLFLATFYSFIFWRQHRWGCVCVSRILFF